MSRAFRYSRWDGSAEAFGDADDVLGALAGDLLESGDADQALRRLMQQGAGLPGRRISGLASLRERLRVMRMRQQGSSDADGLVDAIAERLDRIRELELRELSGREELRSGEPDGATRIDAGEAMADPGPQFAGPPFGPRLNRRREWLEGLQGRAVEAMRGFSSYDFLSPEAEGAYRELVEQLKRHVLEQMLRGAQSLSSQDMSRVKDMVRELNSMIRSGMGDFEGFMQRYGDMFGGVPASPDELLDSMRRRARAAASLMASMSPQAAEQMRRLMERLVDDELASELDQLQQALGPAEAAGFEFSGDEALELSGALQVVERLQDAEELEKFLAQAERGSDLDEVDASRLAEMLGPDAAADLERLRRIERMLEQAGYIRRRGGRTELTARGVRRIGIQALGEVYKSMRSALAGEHAAIRTGHGGDPAGEWKRYEFGDRFHLDVKATILEAVRRSGGGTPVSVRPADFVVERTEHRVRAATALCLDLSLSMPMRGNWVAAKKVALAMHALVSTMFPRDELYLVGFSDYARRLRPEELAGLGWEEVYGTNLQHALIVARRLLSGHPQEARNIIVITDGEPTAHLLDGGDAFFRWPPVAETFEVTLRESARCARDGIVINTFMLDRSAVLRRFVEKMTQLCRGRAFFTDPEHLGEYVLLDVLRSRRSMLRGA